jgi:membrane protein
MSRANDTDLRTNAPHPDSDDKVDSPTDLPTPSKKYVLRKTLREFSKDECTDIAAALTYYAVLAMFPAVIALLSLVSLVGQGPSTIRTGLGILKQVGAGSIARTLQGPLLELSNTPGAGFALVVGLLGALWSASGYVGAFGRAMNRMYEIEEGRPVWKLRPAMLLLTLVLVLLTAVTMVGLVVSGPVAKAIGNVIGLGDAAVTVWGIAKWPVLLVIVILIVGLLYWGTPNIRQPKFRWISLGAAVAIAAWILLSAAFGFYVGNFSSYDKTYGSLAGVIVFLLWLWITNLALLFGAELDAELERGRELVSGIKAEETVQLPPRDTRNIEKAEKKRAEDVAKGRELRLSAGHDDNPDHGPDDGAGEPGSRSSAATGTRTAAQPTSTTASTSTGKKKGLLGRLRRG